VHICVFAYLCVRSSSHFLARTCNPSTPCAQEFWITGDCNGRGATPTSPISDASWPDDHQLFYLSARDVIKRLRNHPCIALWCGGNEQRPAADLDAALQATLTQQPLFETRNQLQIQTDQQRVQQQGCLVGLVESGLPSKASVGEGAVATEGKGLVLDSSVLYVPGSLWCGFGSGDGQFR
jgi:mannosylglycoprotein endo-beta-mannosidase